MSNSLKLVQHDVSGPSPIRLSILDQPFPELTLVSEIGIGSDRYTAIARRWRPGNSTFCRLCPTCSAIGDTCLVVADGDVSDSDAPTYRLKP